VHTAPDRTFSPSEPVSVLYVAGWWHNGSTLAGRILGSADGVFFAGEVRHLCRDWVRGGACSCGRPLPECPTGAEIVARAGIDPPRIAALERRLTRMRDVPRELAALRGRGPAARDARKLTAALRRPTGRSPRKRDAVCSSTRPSRRST
jgi:hypothetical protein